MDIMFEIVSRHKFSPEVKANIYFGEAGGIIGRSDECDWILPDRTKQVSRKHAIITFFNNTFHIEDISTNGIFYSLGRERIPSNTPVPIDHGDGFIIGDYTVAARLMQNASAYVGGEVDAQVLFEEQTLPLNPLQAMDKEDERSAAARLGNFNDLLGRNMPVSLVPHDHSEAPISYLPSITAIPEAASEYDPWDAKKYLKNVDSLSERTEQVLSPDPLPDVVREIIPVPETDAFFATLGFSVPPESPAERERILRTAAELLFASVEGMTQTMQNRAECKNDLRLSMTTTSLTLSNNPLKFSPTPKAALGTLLGPSQKGVMEPVESMRTAFRDTHSHHMGLLAGARAAVSAVLDRIAPQAIEARLDVNGPITFGRSRRLWQMFSQMHHAQQTDHEGFEALFLQSFARAYEMQCRTLNPAAHRRQKGDRP